MERGVIACEVGLAQIPISYDIYRDLSKIFSLNWRDSAVPEG